MKKYGLTISVIFEASSANYGEGFGNITTLKKITRQGGNSYSYISRQALRYNIIEQLGWNNTPIEAMGSGEKKVVQYKPEATIEKYPEIDLFGYMKTEKSVGAKTRSAVARLSNAIALENYNADIDFLTNMGLAKRNNLDNSIAQSEIHRSFYAYTITIDLDRVGIDTNGDVEIPVAEKAQRVISLLDTIEYLYRDIKGRRENLAPVFVIGGVYTRKNPFFENRLSLKNLILDVDKINSTMENIHEDTVVGYLTNSFANNDDIMKTLNPKSIAETFNTIRKKVEATYDACN